MPKKYCKVNGVLYELVEPTMATDEEKVEDLTAKTLHTDAKNLFDKAFDLCKSCSLDNKKQARDLARDMIKRLERFDKDLDH